MELLITEKYDSEYKEQKTKQSATHISSEPRLWLFPVRNETEKLKATKGINPSYLLSFYNKVGVSNSHINKINTNRG